MSWGLQHFKRVQFHNVSSTQWHDQDDSHMTTRYHNASVMSRDAWIHSITFQLNCYDPCRAMNDAESIWVILCWQGIFEMFQDPGPGKWGDQSCSVTQVTAWWPWLHIFYPFLPWDSVRFIRQDLLEGVGAPRFGLFPQPMFIYVYVKDIFLELSVFLIFVAHGCLYFSHTTVLFRWLAATFRFRGFLCFDALLLQAWFGIGVCEQNMDMDRNLWWTQYRNYSYIVYILYR